MNIVDIILLLVIAAAVFLAVRTMKKNRGRCSCGCANCKQACDRKKKESET
jgi:large-conductance mechanosensitive channel